MFKTILLALIVYSYISLYQEWNDFIHSTNELVTVIHGRLQLIVGKEEITLNVGDELFIPARELHSVKNIFDRETQWLFGYD